MPKILIIIFVSIICNNLIAQNYGTWNSFDALNIARQANSAVLLANGNILVAGGENGEVLSSCEIFDVNNKKWRNTSYLNYARYRLTMIRLL
ncbi:MAG: hypothetical protein COT22_02875, partial [Ignavibacteria bacterium CG08_land_8_20_14_0_20_37_9]